MQHVSAQGCHMIKTSATCYCDTSLHSEDSRLLPGLTFCSACYVKCDTSALPLLMRFVEHQRPLCSSEKKTPPVALKFLLCSNLVCKALGCSISSMTGKVNWQRAVKEEKKTRLCVTGRILRKRHAMFPLTHATKRFTVLTSWDVLQTA